jgi:hypothetical protein
MLLSPENSKEFSMIFTRNRTSTRNSPMSNDELALVAPSIFAQAAHESRSSRYAHIPTIAVLDGLRAEGFLPMMATQARVRNDASRQDYTKHMIRLRQQSDVGLRVGEVFPEVVLVNSHDGTSSYQLMAGLFRLVCSNGMVKGAGELGEVRVKHSGDVVREVIDASFRVLDDSQKALSTAQQWSQLQLTEGEQTALALGAHHVRFADAQGNVDTPIQPRQLLQARRGSDTGSDLWNTFNRVQENVIRGGLHGWGRDENGRGRRVTTREVKGIDGNVNLNKALWKMAEHLASLRTAAVA